MSSSVAPQVGQIVRVKKPLADAQMSFMYGGWCAVVTERDGVMAYLDSDAYTRRTGQMQAVSFHVWLPVSDLEWLEEAHNAPQTE